MKGINFKPELIKAIAANRKTQTRRVIKFPPFDNIKDTDWCAPWFNANLNKWVFTARFGMAARGAWIKPRYKVGEVVYTKEAYTYVTLAEKDPWKDRAIKDGSFRRKPDGSPVSVWYKLDGYEIGSDWLNPRGMPAWAARYFIKITDVRPERLQSITRDDAIAEGVIPLGGIMDAEPWCASLKDQEPMKYPQAAFGRLWNSINKPPYDWNSNTWVWRYVFEKANREYGRC